MPPFAKLMLCASVPLLTSCQTEPRPSKGIIIATKDAVWREALCATGKAILISHSDVLTLETAEQIGDHNAALWCACPDRRPEGFNASVCKV